MNTKPYASRDSMRRPIDLRTAGQASDHIGACALISSLSDSEWLREDRGHDADGFRKALQDKG
jgi:hypothetical protein